MRSFILQWWGLYREVPTLVPKHEVYSKQPSQLQTLQSDRIWTHNFIVDCSFMFMELTIPL